MKDMTETKQESGLNIAVETPAAQPAPQPGVKSEPKGGFWWGLGRRKTSVARVRLKPGQGKMLINGKNVDDFFRKIQDRNTVHSTLKAINGEKSFDIFINVRGGGTSGQAGAAMLGIARALKIFDENLAVTLRDGGYLTRDSRMVERKKPGQSGARRRYQFSKR
jgi:small subunit ribosomal protein S9